jgi:hypothetical protein
MSVSIFIVQKPVIKGKALKQPSNGHSAEAEDSRPSAPSNECDTARRLYHGIIIRQSLFSNPPFSAVNAEHSTKGGFYITPNKNKKILL